MPSYLLHFAQIHPEFRIPELYSIAKCYGFELTLPANAEERDPLRAFMVLDLECEEHARILARRCILVKTVYELWASAASYEELHALNKRNPERWQPFTWSVHKFVVACTGHTMPLARVIDVVKSFAYMGLLGKIDMNNPEEIFAVLEEYADKGKGTHAKGLHDSDFRRVYLARLIQESSARPLVLKFDIKKRTYFGNTSMDAEISLLMANQALASPGKYIYDPFVGTGSMLYTAAHFGAFVFGSDIDGRQVRGKESEPGILRSAAQYDVVSRIIDCVVFDVTRNPLRCGELFDSIITDPPYGVRAGAKRLGRKDGLPMRETPLILDGGIPSHTELTYRPPMRPYELDDLARDLVTLSRFLLKPGGRLVFFLPTVTDEYKEVDVPSCDGMTIVANSLQLFGKGAWGRRLITMEKTTSDKIPPPSFRNTTAVHDDIQTSRSDDAHVPAHKGFRDRYFSRFQKPEEDSAGGVMDTFLSNA